MTGAGVRQTYQPGNIQNHGHGTVTQDSGRGNAFNLAIVSREIFDDHLLLAKQIVNI